jgi:hypothetical protein
MAKSNLARKLTKELTRNPKKTAVLGLLALVAIWFWAPLAWKWMAPASDPAVVAGESAATSAPVVTPASVPATRPEPILSWKHLADLVAKEELMASASPQQALKDPFSRPVVEKKVVAPAEESSTSEQPTAPPALPSPEQLGLTLTSTITGGSIRLATINGKLCELGAVLVVPVGNAEYEVTIVDIAPHAVTMKGASEAFTIQHKPPPGSVQLSRAEVGEASVPGTRGQRIIINAIGQE